MRTKSLFSLAIFTILICAFSLFASSAWSQSDAVAATKAPAVADAAARPCPMPIWITRPARPEVLVGCHRRNHHGALAGLFQGVFQFLDLRERLRALRLRTAVSRHRRPALLGLHQALYRSVRGRKGQLPRSWPAKGQVRTSVSPTWTT